MALTIKLFYMQIHILLVYPYYINFQLFVSL